MEKVSRKQALSLGLSRYFTGKPCLRGHVDFRAADKGMCCTCIRELAAKRYAANPAKAAEASARWRAKNPGYAERSRERINMNSRAYRERNREKCAALRANSRARRLQAVPGWFGELDEFAISEAHALAALRNAATGERWEVDHVYPIAGRRVCGLHVAGNIQVVPLAYNRRKSNRMPAMVG